MNLAIYIHKFRTMNHNLPREKGRDMNIERDDKIFNLCKNYIFECAHFSNDRKNIFKLLC